MRHLASLITFHLAGTLAAQDLYFPPTFGSTWETTDPASLGWCTDRIPALYTFLEESNSKAFIVLKDGRIVLERYFGTFSADSSWYWASAGKSLTAFMVGLAQEDGALNINEPSSTYLGAGWTSCTPAQEAAITIRHQLTMTTGLDDTNGQFDCTDAACLTYLTEPGSRWSYYNAPYTLLDGVLEGATGQTLNSYVVAKLSNTTGITGLFVPMGYDHIFFSKARSMARFGLLAQNGGTWDGTPILSDGGYFTAMTTSSQALNPAYGYLWWLNGQDHYRLPGVELDLPGPLMPDAPLDVFSAMGKNGQVINVSPATGLVVVRMGQLPDGLFVPNAYTNQIWQHLNEVICAGTGQAEQQAKTHYAYPNPATDCITLHFDGITAGTMVLLDGTGRTLRTERITGLLPQMDIAALAPGCYTILVRTGEGVQPVQFVRE